jgi:sugar phosphate isomerase/epimerase
MKQNITRRDFCSQAATPIVVTTLAPLLPDDKATPRARPGIASTSFMGAEIGSGPLSARSRSGRGRDTYEFLEKCHALGAGGVQTQLNGDLKKLRARAEQLGMYVEGMISIPRNGDLAALERSLLDAKTAGVTVVRAAMLSGRRYETFSTLADWKQWVGQSHEALGLALPLIEKHKVTVALENHKDWTLEEFHRLLKTYSSEYLRVCLDFGNNLALLDDPLEVVEGLAPYTSSTHLKDMAVRPYADGFLLSEVPLGAGLLDLPKMIAIIQKADPKINFSLEMITRDPLKIPCLTPQYWTVFPDRNGRYLAQTLRLVQERSSRDPLPTVSQLGREERARVEEENVRACLRYAQAQQLIASVPETTLQIHV